MAFDLNSKRGGFAYNYSAEQIQEFQKLTCEQRLKWIDDINRFLYRFMPPQSKKIQEKLRRGEI